MSKDEAHAHRTVVQEHTCCSGDDTKNATCEKTTTCDAQPQSACHACRGPPYGGYDSQRHTSPKTTKQWANYVHAATIAEGNIAVSAQCHASSSIRAHAGSTSPLSSHSVIDGKGPVQDVVCYMPPPETLYPDDHGCTVPLFPGVLSPSTLYLHGHARPSLTSVAWMRPVCSTASSRSLCSPPPLQFQGHSSTVPVSGADRAMAKQDSAPGQSFSHDRRSA